MPPVMEGGSTGDDLTLDRNRLIGRKRRLNRLPSRLANIPRASRIHHACCSTAMCRDGSRHASMLQFAYVHHLDAFELVKEELVEGGRVAEDMAPNVRFTSTAWLEAEHADAFERFYKLEADKLATTDRKWCEGLAV